MASGHRLWPASSRRAAERGGDRAPAGVPGRNDCLRRRVAGARHAVLGSPISARPRRLRWLRLGLWLFLALLWPALAQVIGEAISPSDIRFAMLGCRRPYARLAAGPGAPRPVRSMAKPWWRCSIDAQSMINAAGAIQGPHRCAAAARPEPAASLAADRKPDCRHDPLIRRWLCGVSATRGQKPSASGQMAFASLLGRLSCEC